MKQLDGEMLKRLAAKYVWWKSPDEAVEMPDRVITLVMDMGDYNDMQDLAEQAGDQYLRDVLAHAEIGQFNERSWTYWHYRLGLARRPGDIPVIPQRKLA